MPKAKKPRASKYDEKLAVNGTFEEFVKVSVYYTYTPKDNAKKEPKKKR
jgi:hypothetical protein